MKCIPSYAKYITLGISVGVFVVLSVFYAGSLVPMVLAMILAIMQSRVKWFDNVKGYGLGLSFAAIDSTESNLHLQ